jgi:hypothetical protein
VGWRRLLRSGCRTDESPPEEADGEDAKDHADGMGDVAGVNADHEDGGDGVEEDERPEEKLEGFAVAGGIAHMLGAAGEDEERGGKEEGEEIEEGYGG